MSSFDYFGACVKSDERQFTFTLSSPAQLCAAAFTFVFVLFALIIIDSAFRESVIVAVLVAVPLCLAVAFLVRLQTMRVVVAGDALTVRNLASGFSINKKDIAYFERALAIQTDQFGGIFVFEKDGNQRRLMVCGINPSMTSRSELRRVAQLQALTDWLESS